MKLHIIVSELLSLVTLTLDLHNNENLITIAMGATAVFLILLYNIIHFNKVGFKDLLYPVSTTSLLSCEIFYLFEHLQSGVQTRLL